VAEYLRRVVDNQLDELLVELPAVALDGPKAVGKTETATRRAVTIHRLDDPAQHAIAAADPTLLVIGEVPILIDEWQRFPESWDVVRRAVDADASPGRFLLTGSATPSDAPAHSGAGRIVTLRVRPLSLAERGVGVPTVSLRHLLTGQRPPVGGATDVKLVDYASEIVASGFPALRGLGDRALRAQLDGYLDRTVEHDFVEMGRRIRNAAALRRWLTAYAAASSTTAAYETIRDAATAGHGDKPSRRGTQPYIDILERLWLIEPVPAWLPARNYVSRLAAPPRHQLADPALAARLLGVGVEALLEGRPSVPAIPAVPRGGTLFGALFESLVTLCVRVYAQAAEASVLHLRTKGGEHEVDLIVERDDQRVVAIEVKLTRTVVDADVRHLRWLSDRLGPDLLDAVIVTTGPDSYRRPDGIAVVPAALLGP